MIGGKDVAIDITPSGEVVLQAETPSNSSGIADMVLIAPELVEPDTADQPGRRLGLPLVEVRIEFA
jgi:hypothetical protein